MKYENDDNIGLVIVSYDSFAKCISVIRKYNPVSISEIKKRIETKKYVLDCRYTSTSGVRKIRRCYDELTKNGVVVEIYEHGDLTSREFISNLLGMYQEIEREIDDMIDLETEQDED